MFHTCPHVKTDPYNHYFLIKGAPQMNPLTDPCPNGPCAALFGPCTADSDCMGGNVCVDDMDACMNMISPCCMMGSGAAPRLS